MEASKNTEHRFKCDKNMAQTLGCLDLSASPPTRRAAHAWCRVAAPCIAEFNGALMITLTVALTNRTDAGFEAQNSLAPLAMGAILTSMIYAYGHIGGGHFNPAVSVAVFMRGKISLGTLVAWSVFQVAGAVCGGQVAASVIGSSNLPRLSWNSSVSTGGAFLLEFLFTYALCATVLNTTTTASLTGNQFYGIAVGFVLVAGATAIGPVTGAALNPAFATAFCVVHRTTSDLWLYWAAGLSAGCAAGLVFHVTNNEEADLRFLQAEGPASIEERAPSVGGHTNSYRREMSVPWLKTSGETTSTPKIPEESEVEYLGT